MNRVHTPRTFDGWPRSCARRLYVTARGTTRWRLSYRGRIAKGSYRAYVRGSDASGNVQRTVSARRFPVR